MNFWLVIIFGTRNGTTDINWDIKRAHILKHFYALICFQN